MIEEGSEEAVVTALENAFSGKPPAKPAAQAPQPAVEAPSEVPEVPIEAEGEAAPEEAAPEETPEPIPDEPEFEIEVSGAKEVVKGREKVIELLQKGRDYARGSEENARARESLLAQQQQYQQFQQFQQSVLPEVMQLMAIDQQLNESNKTDWASEFDTNFIEAMKKQQRRQGLLEAKNQLLQGLNDKKTQFERGQAEAAQKLRTSEMTQLLAKLPAWRNSETATAEDKAIQTVLAGHYGFHPYEIDHIMDHRYVLVARDAMKWRELQKTKHEKTKQVREAPPVTRPGASNAQLDPNSKAAYAKTQQEYKRLGQKDHKAQEKQLEARLARAFKI